MNYHCLWRRDGSCKNMTRSVGRLKPYYNIDQVTYYLRYIYILTIWYYGTYDVYQRDELLYIVGRRRSLR